ncbi:MAG TPA: nitrous oxide reductase accessory protein NosL [Gemmatimonadales bacterium]|nr:nitrous oxide reductase accessory protein NosL [Gemmatimonadales bacterium]
MLAVLAACGAPGPTPIAYGSVECDHCHMTVTDPRFSAELVTRKGRVFVFDDPGCLADFLAGGSVPSEDIHSLWFSDFLEPDSLLEARDAVFLRSDSVRTPMNSGLIALRPGPRADSLRAAWGGALETWEDLSGR